MTEKVVFDAINQLIEPEDARGQLPGPKARFPGGFTLFQWRSAKIKRD